MKAVHHLLWAAGIIAWAIAGPAAGQSVAKILVTSAWEGTYTCYQGETGLILTFEDGESGLVGEFAFHPIASNPDIPDGRFKFNVEIGSDGAITATQLYWIERPAEYVMVDFTGLLDDSGTRLAGTINFKGCTVFETTSAIAQVADDEVDGASTPGKIDQ